MGYDVCELETEDDQSTVRVDTWDATGRHWLYYFRETTDGEFELFATADVPYEGDRIETEFGITSAEEKLQREGYEVCPYQH
ncbi:hypothetical protein [Halovivax gelatinilyticus]|uniref:hypothetical protein n=1 Tax=Halovivax gelatinilyticus TaxID=2961597 RepID=UPI0020CA4F0A|nr:hypothetical protein [Halovivax gelatinilyticus]